LQLAGLACWCHSPGVVERIVGRRKEGTGDRKGLDALVLRFGGGAPKGVFRYKCQEEANRDRDEWTSERVQRRMKMSGT
jgi:hypothetical protein